MRPVPKKTIRATKTTTPAKTTPKTIGVTQSTFNYSGQNWFQNIGKNTVSSIIGSYKSAVTKHANRLGLANE